MTAQWEGRPGLKALEGVPRASRHPPETVVEPFTTVYVDDYMNGAWEEWVDELVEVAAQVFELAGVTEKLTKRERGFALVVLGFLFNTQSGVLQIPSEKCEEILALLLSVLERARQGQSVSLLELSSLRGKLTWSCATVVCGRFYLRNLCKLVIAVEDILPSHQDRESFCIPMHWWEI
eukprot:2613358-Rhodomonas_salina.1